MISGKQRPESRQQIAESKKQIVKHKLFAVCYLLSAICYAIFFFCFAVPRAEAQGFLPPKESSSTATSEPQGPLQIGEKVPESLMVLDADGKKRPLLSYKSAVEVMTIAVFSSRCPDPEAHWNQFSYFYRDYKGWAVAFVGINAGGVASREELTERMTKAELRFPLLNEDERSLTRAFKIGTVPELIIIDESGNLRYRGPIGKDARAAIEAVIGHMVPVPNPEPTETGGCALQ